MLLKDLPEEIKTFINHYPIHVLDVRRFTNEECFQTRCEKVFGFIRRSLDKEAVKQYLKEREEQFTNIDEDAYDLIAAMTDTKQLQMVKDKYRSEEGGINMCKGLLDWVEESKIEGKSAGELTILKLITAMQLDGPPAYHPSVIRTRVFRRNEKALSHQYKKNHYKHLATQISFLHITLKRCILKPVIQIHTKTGRNPVN